MVLLSNMLSIGTANCDARRCVVLCSIVLFFAMLSPFDVLCSYTGMYRQ